MKNFSLFFFLEEIVFLFSLYIVLSNNCCLTQIRRAINDGSSRPAHATPVTVITGRRTTYYTSKLGTKKQGLRREKKRGKYLVVLSLKDLIK